MAAWCICILQTRALCSLTISNFKCSWQ